MIEFQLTNFLLLFFNLKPELHNDPIILANLIFKQSIFMDKFLDIRFRKLWIVLSQNPFTFFLYRWPQEFIQHIFL